MKKDNIRDYITEAFRLYSASGLPDADAIKNMQNQLSKGAILDLIAVDETLKYLNDNNKSDVAAAVSAVYFKKPNQKLRKNEITERVVLFAQQNYINESKVWRQLKYARKLCAEYRGLNTGI